MTNPTHAHAEAAIKELLPRFPKRWHKQLSRLANDSFTVYVNTAGAGSEPIYTIKSGNAVLMARCRWETREAGATSFLLCAIEVIHTRGSCAVSINE